MVSIRSAARDDYSGLVPLMQEIHSVHRRALPELFPADAGVLAEAAFRRELASRHLGFLVAERGRDIVGYARVRLAPTSGLDRAMMRLTRFAPVNARLFVGAFSLPWSDTNAKRARRRAAFIDEVVVLPAARGQGVGAALTEACVDWGRSRSASGVELQVYDFNRSAVELYERLGFATVRRFMRKALADEAPSDLSGRSESGPPTSLEG